MSKWNNFKKEFGKFADKTLSKTKELTDSASIKLKIASKEADRDTEYKKLGKLTYSKLRSKTADPDTLTRNISDTLERLDRIFEELACLKKEEAAKQAEKAKKTAEKKSASAETAEKEEADDEKLIYPQDTI